MMQWIKVLHIHVRMYLKNEGDEGYTLHHVVPRTYSDMHDLTCMTRHACTCTIK